MLAMHCLSTKRALRGDTCPALAAYPIVMKYWRSVFSGMCGARKMSAPVRDLSLFGRANWRRNLRFER